MADDEQKIFSLTEAERLRVQLEPVLIEAMESRRKMEEVEEQLRDIAERISRSGGMLIHYEKVAKIRVEFNRLQQSVQSALDRIQETGCVVKDLNVGLLDFPARIDGDEVYLCWKLGEDRIRFYHRQDEGFAGRKPIDPRDAGYSNPVQYDLGRTMAHRNIEEMQGAEESGKLASRDIMREVRQEEEIRHGLGTEIASLFARVGLTKDIPELRA